MAVVRVLLVWLAILVLAVANGVVREALLTPALGPVVGLLVSGGVLALLIVAVAYVALPWMRVRARRHLVGLGLVWLALTLVFEFAFGLWQGKSLEGLLQAYTFAQGNLWPLVLLVTAAAPYLAARLRGW